MKKILLMSGWLMAFYCFLPTASLAQTAAPGATNELILGIPLLTDKSYNDVKATLARIDGVVLVGYCESYKFFLITYDPARVKSAEAIALQVEAANPGYKTEIKVGTSIAKIIGDCTAFPVHATGAATGGR